jgi:hypothetical protein
MAANSHTARAAAGIKADVQPHFAAELWISPRESWACYGYSRQPKLRVCMIATCLEAAFLRARNLSSRSDGKIQHNSKARHRVNETLGRDQPRHQNVVLHIPSRRVVRHHLCHPVFLAALCSQGLRFTLKKPRVRPLGCYSVDEYTLGSLGRCKRRTGAQEE